MPSKSIGRGGGQHLESDHFEAVAKRLECDEDKERFEAALGKIAKPAPKAAPKRKKPGKKPGSPR